MAANTIVFPTDFSSTSDAALSLATSLAHDKKAELLILHVKEPATAYMAGDYYYGPIEPNDEVLTELLHKIKPADTSVPYRHQMAVGIPSEEIVRVAKVENALLIVMSTHGRTGLSRMLMGSVAEVVVRKAPCPVLTFRDSTKIKSQ